jgi:4-hydroxy-3-polyprenylbenzoate decarboxylase
MVYANLRDWLNTVEAHGQLKRISGASWDLEMSSITDLLQKEGKPPMPTTLFDDIPGYPKGFRTLWAPMSSTWRIANALGLPEDQVDRMSLLRNWRQKSKTLQLIPPRFVNSSPLEKNVDAGDKVDILKFPSPRCHELDGGRYIGTLCAAIQKDPDDGWVNIGTYRVMVVDRNRLAFHPVEGQHGSMIMNHKYFARGQVMPVAIAIGVDPALICSSSQPLTGWGISEYDYAGGIKGQPLEVIKGPFTGLPLPASAEIVIEGECHPGELADEGPFGEFHGYYANLRLSPVPEPVIRVKAVHYQDDPILTCSAPGVPPHDTTLMDSMFHSMATWDRLEGFGVPGIRGVWCHELGSGWFFNVVSIEQMYTGHARQVGEIASQCSVHSGRYTIVVEEDIDPSNLEQVLWAVVTRNRPREAINIIDRCHATSTDPAIPLEEKLKYKITPKPLHSSRAVIDGCRGFEWKADWYPIARVSPELRTKIIEKWRRVLPDEIQ